MILAVHYNNVLPPIYAQGFIKGHIFESMVYLGTKLHEDSHCLLLILTLYLLWNFEADCVD